ncbi:hypothetical protein MLD38_028353 [Melastoma candidum]|uniref:Uncharacterized protein n=1 Tax=Melastoma candidum TaxID=119954 RepID=A0ACB9N2C9_9MYRT|nr:hypothetical protein MLD38_028353 [Melastoma candidum]
MLTSQQASTPHVLFFPHLAHGHAIPLLDISKALVGRGVKVTVVTTKKNEPFILSRVTSCPGISVRVLEFPESARKLLPDGCENTADLPSMELFVDFLDALRTLKEPFESLLEEMSRDGLLPLCVISDFFLGWTLGSCRAYGIPRVVFHGMGVFSIVVAKTAHMHVACGRLHVNSDCFNDQTVDLSSTKIPFSVKVGDVPDMDRYKDPADRFLRVLAEIGVTDAHSDGILVNSFEGIEGEYVSSLKSFCINERARIWCVGPASLYEDHPPPASFSNPCMKWLNERLGDNTKVMYVSFGTQARISDLQMDEIMRGLEESGYYFLWAARPKDGKGEQTVPVEGGKGLVIQGWVDQRQVLSHPAVEGFMSHCGWNSVLESLSNGVPMLTWGMEADQTLNAKLVVEGLWAGLTIPVWKTERDGFVPREAIREGVKELMGGEKGKAARGRAKKIARAAREAVGDAGSSWKSLDEFVEFLSSRSDQSLKFPTIN